MSAQVYAHPALHPSVFAAYMRQQPQVWMATDRAGRGYFVCATTPKPKPANILEMLGIKPRE
jgi:hypothetical protein